MSSNAFGCESHSANVDLWLDADSRRIPLGQVCSAFVIALDPTATLPPLTTADLVVSVDGSVTRRSVRLINGMSPQQSITKICFVDDIPF